MTSSDDAELAALQVTLAGEHAAIYVYGVLGARTSQVSEPTLSAQLRGAYAAHRDRRDELIGLIATSGADPVGAAPAYAVPDLADGGRNDANRSAAAIENACAQTYASQVGRTTGETRRRGIAWLDSTAIRELAFGAAPQSLPGAEG